MIRNCTNIDNGYGSGRPKNLRIQTTGPYMSFSFQVVVTAPSVPYKLVIKDTNVKRIGTKELVASSPADWLDRTLVEEYQVRELYPKG
jgi:hypothetical protein